MVVLVARVCPGGTEYGAVDSPGDHNFGGTVDSVTVHVCVHVTNPIERRTGACSREL